MSGVLRSKGGQDVNEYVADLVYIASRLVPPKTETDIREQFGTDLDFGLRLKMIKDPDNDRLPLAQYVTKAGRFQ